MLIANFIYLPVSLRLVITGDNLHFLSPLSCAAAVVLSTKPRFCKTSSSSEGNNNVNILKGGQDSLGSCIVRWKVFIVHYSSYHFGAPILFVWGICELN